MTCECDSCKRISKFAEIVAKLELEEDRKWMDDFLGLWFNESDERDYYKCKWRGNWPHTEFMKCPECGHNIDRQAEDVMQLYNDGENICPIYEDKKDE